MWKRGNFSRSKRTVRWPIRAISVANVEPPGPPPQTTTSTSAGMGSFFCPRPFADTSVIIHAPRRD